MKALESRKQLLIAESELNRAHLISDWENLAGEVHALTHRAKTVGCLASAAVALVSALSFFRRHKSAPTAPKTPWWQTILKGAGWMGSFWSQVRSHH
ncbi:MAG TPA: hypothetical protein VNX46_15850, partial [Candidatus Acidoferrum sp.]|nr:hypothetical protein [Candidatus Acidoferrum sp.]